MIRALFVTILITAPCGVAFGAPLNRDAGGEDLARLLMDEGAIDARDDTSWLMRGLLRDDFARTMELEHELQLLLEQRTLHDVSDDLERHLDMARLRPAPARPPKPLYDIPIADHALVDVYIDYFTGRGRWFFAKWLARAERYKPIMQPILRQRGLPEDTIYLAMIESGFVSKAFSSAAASGFWQFIASTGRQYDLEQSVWLDERRDFERATHSACDYLLDLHREFGQWHLAWAGYNAGGGRIRRALARHKATTFWDLVAKGRALPQETMHYVPKIVAAAIVAKNREHYGFKNVKAESRLVYDTIQVDGAVALDRVGKFLGVDRKMLETLNPALLFAMTPPQRTYPLRVPAGRGGETKTWLKTLPATERVDYRQYRVRKGDTIWRIAERMGSSIVAIREFNGIKDPRSLSPGQGLIIPRLKSVGRKTYGKRPPAIKRKSKRAKPAAVASRGARASHVVSPGETLWSISQRYSVSIASLKQWNGRRSNQIGVGEVLKIF